MKTQLLMMMMLLLVVVVVGAGAAAAAAGGGGGGGECCRNRLLTTNGHEPHPTIYALFLEPWHTGIRGERSDTCTRTVQQHPPCSVITAQEMKLQIRLCTD